MSEDTALARMALEIDRLRDERDHYRENVIPDLQAQFDQERQRRLHAEVLLRDCLQACEVHQRLDGCDKCGLLLDRIDKHFGEWDE